MRHLLLLYRIGRGAGVLILRVFLIGDFGLREDGAFYRPFPLYHADPIVPALFLPEESRAP